MMKKLVLLGIVLTMVMGLGVAANAAYDPSWAMSLIASTGDAGTGYTSTTVCSTVAGGNDALDANDAALPGRASGSTDPQPYLESAIGTEITGDVRGSFTGTDKIWTLTLKAKDYTDPVYVEIQNKKDTIAVKTLSFVPLGGETVKLYSYANGVRGASALWTSTTPGAWTNLGQFAIGSQFQLVASAGVTPPVPEPGSIVAMLSGLVGLAGFGIRRRK